MADSFVVRPEARRPSQPKRRPVFVTGAAGRIGSYFAEHSHDRYDLRLMVQDPDDTAKVEAFGKVVVGELSALDWLTDAMAGADTVVHLAAQPSPDTLWEDVLRDNIVGTYNAFVAAHAAKCRRVVYASSIHAVSGYDVDRQVQPDDPVNPGDIYGVSKCFGEAIGRFMAIQKGLSTICIRIGAFQPVERAREDSVALVNSFVSHDDLTQLIQRSVDDETLQFAIVHGLSNNLFNRMSITEARELLGYEPADSFLEQNPRLRDAGLTGQVKPHSETGKGQCSGIRKDVE